MTRVHTFLWRQRKVCKRKPPGKKASFFPVGAAMSDSATALPG